ncbi:hypothetical protein ZYGR_0H05440 [Zygosaccharomyces rouxii]|uniref:ZYRO0B16566p n=2 Tax=Zygosaccharomyces rouxii TaxID=4956 RepID=C5DSG0_ZYGRC|nr:uncharacterized protein ZYRO0B16566g [Zygosaccharomyces rouxii]KAH9199749.1 hypothetical protein LQ764DRAFT_104850 [Zygosaccharomyces rouxii]GAV47698.1 hypothetical protein ZYGR_0H05440 [Zygosaccharomyces rouxii]CAR26721.1 ZYRO0B16566p [Zygosaccharomyces rouxii]
MTTNEKKAKGSKIKKGVDFDLLVVTESLGYKTYRKNRRNSWSREEDDKLKQLISAALIELGYARGVADIKTIQESERICKNISWEHIANLFNDPARKPKDLRKRWTSSLDPNLKKGKWTPEEDAQLLKAYETHGAHWQSVSESIPGRTEDQCAKRYIEVLGPSTEGRLRKWTLEEDLSLVNKVKKYGTKWRRISSEMEFRPSLTCRNRWRKIITSVVRNKASPEIADAVKGDQDVSSSLSSFLSQGKSNNEPDSEDESSSRENKSKHMEQGEDEEEDEEDESASELETELPSKNNLNAKHEPNTDPAVMNMLDPIRTGIDSENNGQHQQQHQRPPQTQAPQTQGKSPHRSHMEWKYILKDGDELSVSSGVIDSTNLVKELIEQARKHQLKISIHQHIHNHYSAPQELSASEQLQSIQPSTTFDAYSNFRTSTSSPSTGSSSRDLLSNTAATATATKPVFPEGYQEFLSPSPNYNAAFGFEPFSPYAPRPDLPPPTAAPCATPGIVNRGTDEVQDVSRHRVSHFNYLPPALKPQLESSDSTKASNLNILLNPTPSNGRRASAKRRRRKQGSLRSGSNTPGSSHTSPDDGRQQGSNGGGSDHTKSVGSMNDDEGLDFWENLRSLAGRPARAQQEEFKQPNINPFDDESRDLIYGLFNGNGANDNELDSNTLSRLDHQSPFPLDDETFIPFNPS